MTFGNHIHDKAAVKDTIKHVKLAKAGKRRPFAIATLGKFYVAVVLERGKPSAAVSFLKKMRFDPKDCPDDIKGDAVITKASGLLSRDPSGNLLIEGKEPVSDSELAKLGKYFRHFGKPSPFKPPPGYVSLANAEVEDVFTDTPQELAAAQQAADLASPQGERDGSGGTGIPAVPGQTPDTGPPGALPDEPAKPLPQVPEVPVPPPLEIEAYLDGLVEYVMIEAGIVPSPDAGEDPAEAEKRATRLRKMLEQLQKKDELNDAGVNDMVEHLRAGGERGEAFWRKLLGQSPSSTPEERHARAKSIWVPAHQAARLIPGQFKKAVEAKIEASGDVFGAGEESWDDVDEFSKQISVMSFPVLGDGNARGILQQQLAVLTSEQDLADFIDNKHGDVEAPAGGLSEFRDAIGKSLEILHPGAAG